MLIIYILTYKVGLLISKLNIRFTYKVVAVLLAAAVVIFVSSALAVGSNSIMVNYTQNGVYRSLSTNARTVGEFFEQRDIVYSEYDILNVSLDDEITLRLDIIHYQGFNIILSIDGEESWIMVSPNQTISEFIERLSEETGVTYFSRLPLDKVIEARDTIFLQSITTEYFRTNELVDFEVIYIDDEEMYEGETAVLQYGNEGLIENVVRIEYLGKNPVTTTHISSETLIQKNDTIIAVGTKIYVEPEPEPENEIHGFTYSRVVMMESTAYNSGFESTGKRPGHPQYGITASGMPAGPGVVAVDRSVIPFGTRMYIEGYGFAVAGDTGGAIRGYKVDVYIEDMREILQWGRRQVKVYILE
jgi:3D (Asp-Asp-Asp) domain-containing protein